LERTAAFARLRGGRALPLCAARRVLWLGAAGRVLPLCAALAALGGAAAAAAPPAAAQWSAPASPTGCASARAGGPPPQVVFPSSEPDAASGPGMLLWSAPQGCGVPGARVEETGATAGRTTAGGTTAAGATLAADDRPGSGGLLSAAAGLATVTAAAGAAEGQVVAVGTAARAPGVTVPRVGATATATGGAGVTAACGVAAVAEGRAVGAFSPARLLGGPEAPVAAASAYLGDVVVASPVWSTHRGWAVAVRVQRHYAGALAAPRTVPVGAAPEAVAATMDYRAEVLLVWAAGGGVYARELAQGGTLAPVRRLGALPPGAVAPEVQALLSDDGHAIVAWRWGAPAPGGGTLTTLDLSRFEVGAGAPAPPAPTVVERFRDLSAPGVAPERFRGPPGPATGLERPDPPGPAPPPGALRLTRLSSEAVVMAWTGRAAGRYVVRASPVSLRRGAWAPVTISGGAGAAGEDATLADLVPGPDAEALAVWSVTPPQPRTDDGRAGAERAGVKAALLAARGHYAGHGEVSFEAPEAVASPGSYGAPAAAIDPRTGQAVAAWVARSAGGRARVVYALRAPGPASAPPPAALTGTAHATPRAVPGGGSALLPVLAALGLLLAAGAGWRVAAHRPGRRVRARRG
jgi:hypothetical protein